MTHKNIKVNLDIESSDKSLGDKCMANRGKTFKPCIFPFIHNNRLVKNYLLNLVHNLQEVY